MRLGGHIENVDVVLTILVAVDEIVRSGQSVSGEASESPPMTMASADGG